MRLLLAGYTVFRHRARSLSTRGKRRGGRPPGIQYARRGGSPWSTMPTPRRTRGRHTVPRSIVLQIYAAWLPCGRSGVVPEAVSEEPMRSSMSCSSQVKSSQVKSSQVKSSQVKSSLGNHEVFMSCYKEGARAWREAKRKVLKHASSRPAGLSAKLGAGGPCSVVGQLGE